MLELHHNKCEYARIRGNSTRQSAHTIASDPWPPSDVGQRMSFASTDFTVKYSPIFFKLFDTDIYEFFFLSIRGTMMNFLNFDPKSRNCRIFWNKHVQQQHNIEACNWSDIFWCMRCCDYKSAVLFIFYFVYSELLIIAGYDGDPEHYQWTW